MTDIVCHSIRLIYHPKKWKKTREILFEKGCKPDFRLVKSYLIISSPNSIGKMVENVVAEQLSQYWERYSNLQLGQTNGRKKRSAIDAVKTFVHTVQKEWEEQN